MPSDAGGFHLVTGRTGFELYRPVLEEGATATDAIFPTSDAVGQSLRESLSGLLILWEIALSL